MTHKFDFPKQKKTSQKTYLDRYGEFNFWHAMMYAVWVGTFLRHSKHFETPRRKKGLKLKRLCHKTRIMPSKTSLFKSLLVSLVQWLVNWLGCSARPRGDSIGTKWRESKPLFRSHARRRQQPSRATGLGEISHVWNFFSQDFERK
jgi:hypothetical protein